MKKKLSALAYGANLLGRYSKTEQGLRLKMETKNFTKEEIDLAVIQLTELKYLDDLRYAKNYASRFSIKGNYLIKTELIKKGVFLDYIEEAILELDDEMERAKKVALNKWSIIKNSGVRKKQEKLSFFLSSRGFSYTVCRKISEEMAALIEQKI